MIIVGRKFNKTRRIEFQKGMQDERTVARVRCTGIGKFEMKYGQRYFRFLESAFLMAWHGRPRDLGGASPIAPSGTRGIEEWLTRKGFPEFAKWSVSPTVLKRAAALAETANKNVPPDEKGMYKRAGKYVELRPKKGSNWGGRRSRSGFQKRVTDDLPELREECIQRCIETFTEAPYLQYEREWERVNRRKAPASLYRGFAEELRSRTPRGDY